MQDAMHDDDPNPDPICTDCRTTPCFCNEALACGIENPEQCESCT